MHVCVYASPQERNVWYGLCLIFLSFDSACAYTSTFIFFHVEKNLHSQVRKKHPKTHTHSHTNADKPIHWASSSHSPHNLRFQSLPNNPYMHTYIRKRAHKPVHGHIRDNGGHGLPAHILHTRHIQRIIHKDHLPSLSPIFSFLWARAHCADPRPYHGASRRAYCS
jgi:hypothetical protein